MTSRKSSTFWSTILETLLRPEATTRMSTRPNLSTADLTILSQFSSELGRNAMISVLAPSFSHSAATFFSSSALLAARTTLAPAPARVFAASAPKAPDAPAMIAVLPLISNKDSGFLRKSLMARLIWRVSDRNHDRAHFIAAVDDFARFVRLDHAGVIRLEHRLLAVDNDGQFTAQNEINLLWRRGVGSCAAARQEMRVAEDEALGAAGFCPKQAQRGVVAVIGCVVWLGVCKTFDVHQNFLPRSMRYFPVGSTIATSRTMQPSPRSQFQGK